MFIPNNTCAVRRVESRSVRGGRPIFGAPEQVRCALVRLVTKAQKTSVRADSSASKGVLDEQVSDATILFPATYVPQVDDVAELAGFKLRILGAQPRFDVLGIIDHYEAVLEHWAEA